jgi:ribosomal protein L35AE/L33A
MNLESFILGFFDFVGNLDFNMFGSILFVLLILFWLVLIGWVWIDSGERTSNMTIRVIYLVLVLVLNIPGLIIYLIIRPGETIDQLYWADLERRYLKYETSELGDCSKCGAQLLPGYVFCTNCGNEIKKECPNCKVMISKGSKFCAYCGTQVGYKAVKEEEYPTVEVMQQQILATKEEASETVESKRIRYKSGDSFVLKLGNMIISSWSKLIAVIKERVQEQEKKVEVVETKPQVQVVSKKKKKNKKRKKR